MPNIQQINAMSNYFAGDTTSESLNIFTDFGRDRINFLHSSLYGATFWICDLNSVDSIGMFKLLLNSAYTVSSLVIKAVGEKEEGRGFWSDGVCLSKSP